MKIVADLSLYPLKGGAVPDIIEFIRELRRQEGIEGLVATGFANFIEVVCEFLRKQVAEPALEHHTDRFIKYIWSVFFFILTMNLLGLLPIRAISALWHVHLGGTATGDDGMVCNVCHHGTHSLAIERFDRGLRLCLHGLTRRFHQRHEVEGVDARLPMMDEVEREDRNQHEQ